MSKTVSIIIIIVSTLLMQFHSIGFWVEHAGYTGIGFSIALEVVALWLWWQRCRWLALVASLLLIGGPLFHISSPVISNINTANSNAFLMHSYQQEVKQLNDSLARYDKNSGQRLGWSARIDNIQTQLTAARNKLRELSVIEASETSLRLYLVVLMQALTLMVILRAQVMAVTSLPLVVSEPRKSSKPEKGKKTAINKPVESIKYDQPELNDFDKRVIAVGHAMHDKFLGKKAWASSFAEDCNVRAADISLARNHLKKLQNGGKEIISESALSKIEKVLEIVN